MKIETIVVGMVQTNCYVVSDTVTKQALIIDPGAEAEQIAAYIRRGQQKPLGIFLTHGHFDHIMGVNALRQSLSVPVYAGEKEEALLLDAALNCSYEIRQPYSVAADELLKDGETRDLGGFTISVVHTPGHTEGGVCYHIQSGDGQAALFCGDTLFMESVGRTDLPTGNSRKLLESVKKLLDRFPGELPVYPGHGPKTSIAYESANNPYAVLGI